MHKAIGEKEADGNRRKNDRRIYRGARKEATGPDQLEVIPRVESPASQSMKFFLSPRCTGLLEEWPSLFLLSRLSQPNIRECVGALENARIRPRFRILLLCPNRSLSAPSGRTGDTRLDSSQLHRRFTIQFHLESAPALRFATQCIDYRSTLACARRKRISEGPQRFGVSYTAMQMQEIIR